MVAVVSCGDWFVDFAKSHFQNNQEPLVVVWLHDYSATATVATVATATVAATTAKTTATTTTAKTTTAKHIAPGAAKQKTVSFSCVFLLLVVIFSSHN